jgi:hypothetical protein
MSTSFLIVATAGGYYLIFAWHALVVARAMVHQYAVLKVLIQNSVLAMSDLLRSSCWDQSSFFR